MFSLSAEGEDTPQSGGSFGDNVGNEQQQQQLDQQQQAEAAAAAAAAKQEQLEREKLPPYLPSIRGCRSVEEFKV